jgi:hypothetical protein
MDCFLWRGGLAISTMLQIGGGAQPSRKGGAAKMKNPESLSQAIAFCANINSVSVDSGRSVTRLTRNCRFKLTRLVQ